MESGWQQYAITFPDRDTAETTAARHLAPTLEDARATGRIGPWWYIRKSPTWRLRVRPGTDATALGDLLGDLATRGHIAAFVTGIYEPETLAFGGPAAMETAHTLFEHDSRHILARTAHLEPPPLGRRETTVMLFSLMLRTAGLDRFEQGDVWNKVAGLRPIPPAPTRPGHREALARLTTTDPRRVPEHIPTDWAEAFVDAGRSLAALHHGGHLERGLRAVLAHHFIFTANRAGLSARHQAALAHLAVDDVFHHSRDHRPRPSAPEEGPEPARVREMTNTLGDTPVSPASITTLRHRLADRLRDRGAARTPAVHDALRTVPRHLFVPHAPIADAYADEAVYTKERDGVSLSAASQPTIVATMLEQLAVEPGHHILELGAGTGYNAALLAAIAGPHGHVTTIDVDEDLVTDARAHLDAARITGVDVVLGDGALGHPKSAPYDRVVATVGAHEVPTAWLDQLAPDGRLLVPLRLAGAASRTIAFERENGDWVDRGSEMAVFMPLRGGIGDDSRTVVDLTGTGEVTLQTHRDNHPHTDPTTLAGVLDNPRHTTWSGVTFGSGESFEWLDLWLACAMTNPIMRMNVQATARERGLVAPMFPIAAMATTTPDGTLAYLTIRAADPVDDAPRYEVGVIAHGPHAADLADTFAGHVSTWDRDGFRTRTVRFALEDHPAPTDPSRGRFVLTRPDHPVTVTWQ
ncbi:methyltransferase, FxLD system [Embleya scabrispora]|uniref:Protein-L-isoaspartate O-methyltransferase n=1 Tax=Embleya scabrispora TaxID=159449 RepID=A0A1T3NJG5_9ACTN|nr:methyltransferase, FxLD system [Embleya scabrispora]OPC76771.1 methyltransferase, FxLD system [Embleya scabrispora]